MSMTKAQRDEEIKSYQWLVRFHTQSLAQAREQAGHPLTGRDRIAVISHYVAVEHAVIESMKSMYHSERNEFRPSHRHLMKALKEVSKVQATYRQVYALLPEEIEYQYRDLMVRMQSRVEDAAAGVERLTSPMSPPGLFNRMASALDEADRGMHS